MIKRSYFLFYLLITCFATNAQSDEFFAQNHNLNSLSEELSSKDLLVYLEAHPYSDDVLQRQSLLLQAKFNLKLKDTHKANQISNAVINAINDPEDSISIYQVARAYELKGHIQHKLNQLDSAYYYIDYSSFFYLQNFNFEAAVYNYNMISTIFYLHKNNKDALKQAYKALNIFEENHTQIDSSYYIDLMVDIGNIYMSTENYDKSIETYLELFKHPNQMNDNQQGDAHNNMGYAYLRKLEGELAKVEFESAEGQYLKTNNLKYLSRVYNNLALLYVQEYKDFKNSVAYYKKSIALKKELNEKASLATTYLNLSALFYEMNQIDSSLMCAFSAEKIFNDLSQKKGLSESYDMIAKIYHRIGVEDSAYVNLRKHSMLEVEMKRIAEKESSQTIINQRNVILQQKELELLEKEKELTALKLDRSRTYLLFTSSSFIFMLLVFYMYMRFAKHKQKVEKDIHKRKITLTTVKSLVKGQEDERNRIARDLHDGVGNSLTLLNHKAMAQNLPEIQKLTNQISQEVRDISHNIMPGILLKLGLKEALFDLAESWNQTGVIIDISYTINHDVFEDVDAQLTLFRALQEIIKNAIEKGKSNYIAILFIEDTNGIKITIEDNGAGFDMNKKYKGQGLDNIHNRIIYLKGEIDILSTDNGSTILITLPKR